MHSVVLAGDIGGTNSRLGLFSTGRDRSRFLRGKIFPSQHYDSLERIVEAFLDVPREIGAACFGVAGPVIDGTVTATNLPWLVKTRSLQAVLGLKKVVLINDLVAVAHGIPLLRKRDCETLNVGRKQEGNAALIAAGTGLGIAVLFWDGKQHIPSPSEGGHVEFGPNNEAELDLLRYLHGHYEHVSYERILSGPGLLHIYQFLRDIQKFAREPSWLSKRMELEDPPKVMTEVALSGRSKLCEKALDMFISIYGAAAGNLALHSMAVAGVYMGGGIAPKILSRLKGPTFMEAFKDKGRLSGILEDVPVKVILNDRTAVLGAARYAGLLLQGGLPRRRQIT
jgi:glucokinase